MKVVQPPVSEEALQKTAKWLFEGLNAIGFNLELEGFLLAWTGTSTKFIVDTDSNNVITSAAIIAFGKKWTDSENSATVIGMFGPNRLGLLSYIGEVCNILRVGLLFYVAESEDEPGELVRMHKLEL